MKREVMQKVIGVGVANFLIVLHFSHIYGVCVCVCACVCVCVCVCVGKVKFPLILPLIIWFLSPLS